MATVSADEGEMRRDASRPAPPMAWTATTRTTPMTGRANRRAGSLSMRVPMAEARPQERQEGGD